MTDQPPFLLDRSGRPALAYRHRHGRGPTILFMPGYMSDMEGTKALAIDEWAGTEGRAMLRFDYSGCGASEGIFTEQALADWRDDALAMIDMIEGPVLLIGSSMGGWLMLLAALARPGKVVALIGIAAAPDFTSWGFTSAQKRLMLEQGRVEEPSAYDDQPYVTTRIFWESGEGLKLLEGQPIAIECPVRLLHGLADAEVPWRISLQLMERLRSADVQLQLLKDGDHRLSRPPDLTRLIATLQDLLEVL